MRRPVVLALVAFGACAPFGSSGNDGDAPSTDLPAKTDAGKNGAEGGTDASVSNEGAASPNVVPLLPCPTIPETRSLDFETAFVDPAVEWDATHDGVDITREIDPERPTMIGHFRSTTAVAGSDGATVRVKSWIQGDADWARVEWDSATLQADPYSCFGCTVGPMGLEFTNITERGRAYLATEKTGEKGVFPTLDSWWDSNHVEPADSPLTHYQATKWQHFILEVTFDHDSTAPKLSVHTYVDGVLDRDLTNQPWDPEIKGITSTCGALYTEPQGSPTTIDVKMDNIRLSVCHH